MLLFAVLLLIFFAPPFLNFWIAYLRPTVRFTTPMLCNFYFLNFVYAFAIAVTFGWLR